MKLKDIIESTSSIEWIDVKDRVPTKNEINEKLLTWDEVNGLRLINISAAPKPKLPSDVEFWCIPEKPKT